MLNSDTALRPRTEFVDFPALRQDPDEARTLGQQEALSRVNCPSPAQSAFALRSLGNRVVKRLGIGLSGLVELGAKTAVFDVEFRASVITSAKWSRLIAAILVSSLTLVGVATSTESDLLNPKEWKASRSKSGVNYIRCVAVTCDQSTIVSYTYMKPNVGLAPFIASGEEIRRAFLRKGIATKVDLGKPASSTMMGLKLYSQTARLTKPDNSTEIFEIVWLVGTKASLDIAVSSAEDAKATKVLEEFIQLSGGMLALWEVAPKGSCLRNDVMPSCFGPE